MVGLAAVAGAEPSITLPPDEPPPPHSIPRPSVFQLPREYQMEVSLNRATMEGTAIGGYGELTLNVPSNGDAVVDLRRLVVFLGHNFTDRLRLYTEIEIEHAVSSADDRGEVEVEQAFLDYLAWKPLNFRAGVLLIPMGIVNVYHEPPTFNGVDRPETDQVVIPSTWREPGLGIFGALWGVRYQVYVVNGFNATGFSATYGLREGHQEAQLALGHDWGVAARVDYPFPSLLRWGISADLGASFYYAHADQGQKQFRGSDGDAVPVTIASADLRLKTRGLELRAEWAQVWIGGIRRLNRGLESLDPNTPFEGPVSHQLLGGYVELAYNVLHPAKLRSGIQLVPFLRYEHTDTQLDVPTGWTRVKGNLHDTVTAGLTFRPLAEVAVKLDYQHVWTDADAPDDAEVDRFNAGLAFMF